MQPIFYSNLKWNSLKTKFFLDQAWTNFVSFIHSSIFLSFFLFDLYNAIMNECCQNFFCPIIILTVVLFKFRNLDDMQWIFVWAHPIFSPVFYQKNIFKIRNFKKKFEEKLLKKRKKSFKLLVGYIFFIKIKNPNNYRMWLCVWWLWWWLWWKFEYRNNVLYDDDCLAPPLLLMMVIFLSMITVEFFYI